MIKHIIRIAVALLTFMLGVYLTPRYTELKCGYIEPRQLEPGEFDPAAGLEEAVKGGGQ